MLKHCLEAWYKRKLTALKKKKRIGTRRKEREMRCIEDPNTQRDREQEREIATMATRFKEKGEKPITPLSSQKPKNQNHILPPKSKSKT